jgi:drug/metabolite transporter (DMT)-like permease
MLTLYVGYIAALATSVAWSATSILFTLSGREVDSPVVNRTRLVLALLLVSLTHWLTEGSLLPVSAEPSRWGWLLLSGVIGFTLGDSFLFQAFILIGPRLSMLLMALAPVFSVSLGWLLLGERLSLLELIGVGITLAGTGLVVTDRRGGNPGWGSGVQEQTGKHHRLLGVLLGLGGALGQAVGLYFSRLGLAGDFPALSGSLIRIIAAVVSIWLLTLAQCQVQPTFEKLRASPRALWVIAGGAVTGPFIGVWLSLVAVQHASLGIASTLMSLSPVILLPASWFVFRERFGVRAVAGTLMAVAGTAILFL